MHRPLHGSKADSARKSFADPGSLLLRAACLLCAHGERRFRWLGALSESVYKGNCRACERIGIHLFSAYGQHPWLLSTVICLTSSITPSMTMASCRVFGSRSWRRPPVNIPGSSI
jgi:hypothetical protein